MPSIARQVSLVAAFLFGVLLAGNGCKKKRSSEDSSDGPSNRAPDKPAEFKVNAGQLFAEIKGDKEAALTKYADKWVEVSGAISFVGAYDEKKLARTLGLHVDEANALYCDVAQSERSPGKFSLGQSVVLKLYGGKEGSKSPSLRLQQGQVVSAGPSQVLKVNAEDLCKDYAQDPMNADNKYRKKTLALTATIAEVRALQFDRKELVMKNSSGINLIGETNFKLDPLAQQLKSGDSVTMTGFVMSFTRFDKKIQFYNFEVVPK